MPASKPHLSLPVATRTAATALAALLLAACAHTPSRSVQLRRFEFQRPEMGMPIRMVLYAPSHLQAADAALAAFDRIRELNAIFSDYEPDSELSRLSLTAGEGRAIALSTELADVLCRAQRLAVQTEGAFDVTVGPCVNLWRRARRQQEFPKPELMARARAAVGYRHLELDFRARTARLRVPNMRLDLGGIAKGYALEAAWNVLRQRGIRSALITGSGDMRAGDPPPGQAGWRIELAALDLPGAPPAQYLHLRNQALATSGDMIQYVELAGTRYSHIVDPRTGLGLTNRSLVHILAPDAAKADSLATAVSVLGPDRGIELIKTTPGVAGRIAYLDGDKVRVRQTSGFSTHMR